MEDLPKDRLTYRPTLYLPLLFHQSVAVLAIVLGTRVFAIVPQIYELDPFSL
jgi:hypothetical protein